MNIKEAKNQIKNSMIAYFSKDEFGNYIIPIEKQRPIFMIGAPGIGKTAIMKQIAEELGVCWRCEMERTRICLCQGAQQGEW